MFPSSKKVINWFCGIFFSPRFSYLASLTMFCTNGHIQEENLKKTGKFWNCFTGGQLQLRWWSGRSCKTKDLWSQNPAWNTSKCPWARYQTTKWNYCPWKAFPHSSIILSSVIVERLNAHFNAKWCDVSPQRRREKRSILSLFPAVSMEDWSPSTRRNIKVKLLTPV